MWDFISRNWPWMLLIAGMAFMHLGHGSHGRGHETRGGHAGHGRGRGQEAGGRGSPEEHREDEQAADAPAADEHRAPQSPAATPQDRRT